MLGNSASLEEWVMSWREFIFPITKNSIPYQNYIHPKCICSYFMMEVICHFVQVTYCVVMPMQQTIYSVLYKGDENLFLVNIVLIVGLYLFEQQPV